MIPFLVRIYSTLHVRPTGTWCNAVTIPVAPVCRISPSVIGSRGPNQRHVSSSAIGRILRDYYAIVTVSIRGTRSVNTARAIIYAEPATMKMLT